MFGEQLERIWAPWQRLSSRLEQMLGEEELLKKVWAGQGRGRCRRLFPKVEGEDS